jgi:hypothetical protein
MRIGRVDCAEREATFEVEPVAARASPRHLEEVREAAIQAVTWAAYNYSQQVLHGLQVFLARYGPQMDALKSQAASGWAKTAVETLGIFFKPIAVLKVSLNRAAERLDQEPKVKEAIRQVQIQLHAASVQLLRTDLRQAVHERDFWVRLAEETAGRTDWRDVVAARAPREFGLPSPEEPTARRVVTELIREFLRHTLAGPENGFAAVEKYGHVLYSPTFSFDYLFAREAEALARRLLPEGGR